MISSPTSEVPDEVILVLRLRNARRRAKLLAATEVASLMRRFCPRVLPGGPLSEERGVAWVGVHQDGRSALSRITSLGYSQQVLVAADEPDEDSTVVRWKKRDVFLAPAYYEPDSSLSVEAPDKRTFRLLSSGGGIRTVVGYRGGNTPLSHRALPAVDARMLVNIVSTDTNQLLLDPFGGAGGIVLAATRRGHRTVSADIDPVVGPGMADLSDLHHVADARSLPIETSSIDCIATEPPFHAPAHVEVLDSLVEMYRVLRSGGLCSIMVSSEQGDELGRRAEAVGFDRLLRVAVDRKGTPVDVFLLKK